MNNIIKFLLRYRLIGKLKNGYILIRYPYGNYVIKDRYGNDEIVPLWLGIYLWDKNIVVPILDVGNDLTRYIVFRLVTAER